MSSSSSFRAERGRRSRDAADADDAAAAAHSICGKMQSFFVRVLWLSFVCERGNRTYSEKTAFFSLFFISPKWHRQSPFPSRNRRSKQKLIASVHSENLQNYTRRLALTHAHALKTFTSSRPRKKKRERERERGTFHSRAFFSFKTRSRVSSSIHLSCPKNRNVARLPSISYQKSPSTCTGDAPTQERIDKYTHI